MIRERTQCNSEQQLEVSSASRRGNIYEFMGNVLQALHKLSFLSRQIKLSLSSFVTPDESCPQPTSISFSLSIFNSNKVVEKEKAESRNSAANNLPPTRQASSHTDELHAVRRRKTADKGNNFSRTNLIHPRHFNISARRHIYTHNFSIGNRFFLFRSIGERWVVHCFR